MIRHSFHNSECREITLPVATPTSVLNLQNPWVTLGAGGLTWQFHSTVRVRRQPSGFRVQVVALHGDSDIPGDGKRFVGLFGGHCSPNKGCTFSDWKGKKEPEGLALELKASLTEDYLPLEESRASGKCL